MIEKMHERTNGPVFKIIFALVSLSFVLGGFGTGFIGGNNYAAKVNGEEISPQTFNSAKNRQQQRLNAEMGEQFWDLMDNPEYAGQFNRSVLDSLIENELLRQYAKELKLGISTDQIKSQIVNDPNFQQDGKFDNALYQQVLRNNGINGDYYAALVSEGMLFSQIQEGVSGTEFSVPAQQELLAKLLLQQRNVRLATYSIASAVENQTVTAEELQAYYDAHKNDFMVPEKLTVEYISLTPNDVKGKVEITDEQIQTYYDKNQSQYATQAENHLAHIQVADEKAAQEIVQALKNGEDFAKLAAEKSQDTLSAKQGGDLGWAKAGTFPAEFEQAANALKAGEYSNAVKVGDAYHIIKVVESKAAKTITLAEVKEKIADTIRQELTAAEYSNVARLMANDAFENNGSLEAAAKTGNVQIQTTAEFDRQSVPAELNNEKILKALFEGELRQNGQNSEALDISEGDNLKTMFVRVSNYKEERAKTFEEAKSDVESALKRQKAEESLLKQADEYVKALNAGQSVNVAFGESQNLIYAQALNTHPRLVETVFSMPKPNGKQQYGIARNESNDIVIVALDSVQDGKLQDFKTLAPQFAQADQRVLQATMLKDLRNRASIDINEELIAPNSNGN